MVTVARIGGCAQVVVAVTVLPTILATGAERQSVGGWGEVRRLSGEDTELVVDVSELIWEPIEL